MRCILQKTGISPIFVEPEKFEINGEDTLGKQCLISSNKGMPVALVK